MARVPKTLRSVVAVRPWFTSDVTAACDAGSHGSVAYFAQSELRLLKADWRIEKLMAAPSRPAAPAPKATQAPVRRDGWRVAAAGLGCASRAVGSTDAP